MSKEGFIEKKLKKSYVNFEESLEELVQQAKQSPVSVETLLRALNGRGKLLLLSCLSLSFCQMIPGTGIFFGLLIAYLGVRIALQRSSRIFMPKPFLQKKIPSSFLIKRLSHILSFLNWMKRWSQPRHLFPDSMIFQVINGIMVSLIGISLAICLPIPFCSIPASFAIFFISIGLLNNDDAYLIAGYTFALLFFSLAVFLTKIISIGKIIGWIHQLFS